MAIDKFDYIAGVLKTNPGEVFDIIASAFTTFKFRFLKRCIAKGTIIRKKTEIINYANVKIGKNCIFQDFIYLRAGIRGKIVFENDCMVNSFCKFFGHGGIEIGARSQLGPGVTITTTVHDYATDDLSEVFKKVTIGKKVWIGANVTILPGVSVGDNTVIGAGSVVTKDIPPDSIAVGVPAKVIRRINAT